MIRSVLVVAAALAMAAVVTAHSNYDTVQIDGSCIPRLQEVTTSTETFTTYLTDTYYHVNTFSKTRCQSLLLTTTLQLTQYLTQALTQTQTSTRFQLIGVTQPCPQIPSGGSGIADMVGY
ncbi:uncharacterized protein [Procambarus clarkii]|uniref:uncharacterized protein isoform X1 n=1 Tax=Procambarus clarkii TaxID=6728 RepID=UPI0037427C0C